MTLRDALARGAALLSEGGGESPVLDASLLLSHALGIDRAALLARGPEPVNDSVLELFKAFLARRRAGEAVAYILGRKEFWGMDFRVDRRVLVPRPETEHLVEAALEAASALKGARPLRLHDACTGSGCVGIALSAELLRRQSGLELELSLSDISPEALQLARENAERLLSGLARPGPSPGFILSDLLSGVEGLFEIITANPPYLAENEMNQIRSGAGMEPALALDGGPDGLALYRRLIPQAAARLAPGAFLAVEIGWTQGPAVRGLFREAGFSDICLRQDLGGRDRVVQGWMGCKRS